MARAKTEVAIALPARLECLRPYFTAEIVEAAMARLILRTKFPDSFDRPQRKLALILIRELNPDELIDQGEEAILRGVKDETLKGHKDEGSFPRFVNGSHSRQR